MARETLGQEVAFRIAKRRKLHRFLAIPKRWVVAYS
jgi:hypothetical protein